MSLWLAIGVNGVDEYSSDHLQYDSLGVCEACSDGEAFYTFMKRGVYPRHVVELPKDLEWVAPN